MTERKLLKLISQELSDFMESHQYHCCALGEFVRTEKTLDKCILFTISKWSNGTGFHVDHYAAYRLPDYNRLLGGPDNEKKVYPTISVYFLNLVPKGFDWKEVTVATELEILKVAQNIERICTQYSFSFLDKFPSAEAIIDAFHKERNSWPDQDPILRYRLLLLDAVLKKELSTFNHWLEETVRFCGSRKDCQAVALLELARSLKNHYFA